MTTNESYTPTLLDVENALVGLKKWHERSAHQWRNGEPHSPLDAERRTTIAVERERMASDLGLVLNLLREACQGILDQADGA